MLKNLHIAAAVSLLLLGTPSVARSVKPSCAEDLKQIAPQDGRIVRRSALPARRTIEKVVWSRMIRDQCRLKESDVGCVGRLQRDLTPRDGSTRVQVILMGPFSRKMTVTMKADGRTVTRVFATVERVTEMMRAAIKRGKPVRILKMMPVRDPAKRWAWVNLKQIKRVTETLKPGSRLIWKPSVKVDQLASALRGFEKSARAKRLRLERIERLKDGSFQLDLRCY